MINWPSDLVYPTLIS